MVLVAQRPCFNMNAVKRFCLLFCLASLLTACVSRPDKVEVPAGWTLQKQQLEALDSWQLRGKLAYKNADDKFGATLVWSESEQNSELRLLNPLGITLVDITVTPTQASLEADGKVYQDDNIDSLLFAIMGWNIPVNALRRWIIGLPNDTDNIEFNDNGTIGRLYPQCGGCDKWQIDYLDYTQYKGVIVPRTLIVTDTSQDATIKIRVSSWR